MAAGDEVQAAVALVHVDQRDPHRNHQDVTGLRAVVLAVLVQRKGGVGAAGQLGTQVIVAVEGDLPAEQRLQGIENRLVPHQRVQLG